MFFSAHGFQPFVPLCLRLDFFLAQKIILIPPCMLTLLKVNIPIVLDNQSFEFGHLSMLRENANYPRFTYWNARSETWYISVSKTLNLFIQAIP